MRKKAAFLLVFIILASALFYFIYDRNKKVNSIKHPIKSSEKKISFKVSEGEDLNKVIKALSSKGNINNEKYLLEYIKNNNVNTSIKSGEYSFSTNISFEKFCRYLNKGILDDVPVKITIPEGYDIEKISVLLEKKGILLKGDFIKSVKEYPLPDFIKKDEKRRYSLEGFLFPDTYEFYKGTSGKVIIDEMVGRFKSVISEIEKKRNLKVEQRDIDKIVTMASVIEKEVDKQDERTKAASVFYNRIKKGMKLESCATVIYALGYHKDKLYYNDLKVNSPYNTYQYSGLPVGPICNPGKECLEAAITPEKTNYLFFVQKKDGTHFFTEDYNKFLEAKRINIGE